MCSCENESLCIGEVPMEPSDGNEDGEPHYFTFEVSWEVANKGIVDKRLAK